MPLADFTTVDARVSLELAGRRISIEATNLLDRRYGSTAFPDPAGTGSVYYDPAAGRALRMEVSAAR